MIEKRKIAAGLLSVFMAFGCAACGAGCKKEPQNTIDPYEMSGCPDNAYSNPGTFYKPDGKTEFVGIADPFCIRGNDEYFYLYSTQLDCTRGEYGFGTDYGPIFRSKNLTEWEWCGSVFLGNEQYTKWNNGKGGVWAPTVCQIGENFCFYYTLGSGGYYDDYTGIGVAVSPTPYGPWTHYGKLFDSGEIGVKNSIDPYVMVDDGRVYMVWGSGDGIWICELDETGTQLKGGLEKQREEKVEIAGFHVFDSYNYEGSFIMKRDGFYYLFLSTGTCCDGLNSTYTCVAGRSESLYGPYRGKDGLAIDRPNRGTAVVKPNRLNGTGTGHIAVVQDSRGCDWLIYHAYNPNAETLAQKNTRTLYMDRLYWVDGFPTVKDATPSAGQVNGPYIK